MQKNSGDHYLSGLIRGDSAVIRSIYDEYLDKITLWVCQNNGGQSDAKDIFQEALTMILISARKGTLQLRSSFGGYLFTSCKYIWYRRLKKENSLLRVRTDDLETPSKDELINIDQSLEDYWLHTFLERNRQKLSDTCKSLLELISKKVAPSLIADKLGMSNANTVYRRKSACFQRWRELIERDPFYHNWKESQYES